MLINVRLLFEGGNILMVVFVVAFFGTAGKAIAACLLGTPFSAASRRAT